MQQNPQNPPNLQDLETLLGALPADWEARMERHGLLSRHPDAKFREPRDLLRYVLLHVGANLPLRQTCALAAQAGLPKVAHAALHFKMRRMGPFLHELVEEMTTVQQGSEPERWAGYQLVALDGSVVVMPGPTGQGGRLHVALRLSDATVVSAQVTTTANGETLRNFDWEPGQLVVADRGYSHPPGIAHVAGSGADVLVRWARGSLPLYDDEDDLIDVLGWVRSLPKGHHAQHRMARVLCDDDVVVHGRLVAVRLPAEQAKKARDRVLRENGPDPIALELASWIIVYTTAPLHRLTDSQVVAAYRVRWQVELLFKRWKSLCHFDYLPNYRHDTLVSWLYAKLLLALCLERLATQAQAVDASSDHVARAALQPPPKFVLQPWKMTSLLWPAILAAIFPVGLRDLVHHAPTIIQTLDSHPASCSPCQVRQFRDKLGTRLQLVA